MCDTGGVESAYSGSSSRQGLKGVVRSTPMKIELGCSSRQGCVGLLRINSLYQMIWGLSVVLALTWTRHRHRQQRKAGLGCWTATTRHRLKFGCPVFPGCHCYDLRFKRLRVPLPLSSDATTSARRTLMQQEIKL